MIDAMRVLRKRIRAAMGKDLFFSPDINVPVEVHGSTYGGWAVLKDSLNQDSVVISVGIGEDTTFDMGVIAKYGCKVYAYDPTPKAIKYVEENVRNDKFLMHQCALADHDGTLELFFPAKEEFVSASMISGSHTRDEKFVAKASKLSTIMQELGVDSVDVLKIDIEGAEYSVIDELLASKTLDKVSQLDVEFHHFQAAIGLEPTRKTVAKLRAAGWKVAWVSPAGFELLFVRG